MDGNTDNLVDHDDENNGFWRNEIGDGLISARMRSKYVSKNKRNAEELRDKLIEYFNTAGAVPWQYKMVQGK